MGYLFRRLNVVTWLFLGILSFFLVLNKTKAAGEQCEDNSPGSKPVLVSATVSGDDSVTLVWTEVQDPVTHYLVAYSRSETEIEYGNPNVGNRGTTTYTVGKLTNGVKYYFKIRPINGCRPGDFSNKLSAIPGTTAQFGVGSVTSGGHTPNLSIYKSSVNIDIQATDSATVKSEKSEVITNSPLKCSTCVGWPLLIAEVLLLVVFLYFANKNAIFKPVFSLVIPILIYILFLKINQNCLKNIFTCKYFLPLEIIAYIFIEIVYKAIKSNTAKKK